MGRREIEKGYYLPMGQVINGMVWPTEGAPVRANQGLKKSSNHLGLKILAAIAAVPLIAGIGYEGYKHGPSLLHSDGDPNTLVSKVALPIPGSTGDTVKGAFKYETSDNPKKLVAAYYKDKNGKPTKQVLSIGIYATHAVNDPTAFNTALPGNSPDQWTLGQYMYQIVQSKNETMQKQCVTDLDAIITYTKQHSTKILSADAAKTLQNGESLYDLDGDDDKDKPNLYVYTTISKTQVNSKTKEVEVVKDSNGSPVQQKIDMRCTPSS